MLCTPPTPTPFSNNTHITCRYDGRYNLYKRASTVKKKAKKMNAVELRSRFLPLMTRSPRAHLTPKKRKGSETLRCVITEQSDLTQTLHNLSTNHRYVKELASAKVKSRVSHRCEQLRRGMPAPVPAAKSRDSQAIPPDPLPSLPPTPDSSQILISPSPYEACYEEIPDSALAGFDSSDGESLPELVDSRADALSSQTLDEIERFCDGQVHPKHRNMSPHSPSRRRYLADVPRSLFSSILSPSPTPPSPTPPTSSAPPTPPLSLSPAASLHASYSYPCSYPAAAHATERDFRLDYETVMDCVNDLQGITKFIMGRGGSGPRQPDPTGVETTREEVIEHLLLLKSYLDRLVNRFEL